MLSKEVFARYAKRIDDTIHFIDKASDTLGFDFWESDLVEGTSIAIELLAVAMEFDTKDDILMEAFFSFFWRDKKFDDDPDYWANCYNYLTKGENK